MDIEVHAIRAAEVLGEEVVQGAINKLLSEVLRSWGCVLGSGHDKH